jgi:hypothetical protein
MLLTIGRTSCHVVLARRAHARYGIGMTGRRHCSGFAVQRRRVTLHCCMHNA